MNRPRLLDLYCSEGGATRGYQLAGFEVTGVDIDQQPNYIGERFVQADAIEYVRAHGHEYDAIHASPPCQRYSTITSESARDNWPDLIAPTREELREVGLPYVIENVEGAKSELIDPMLLCGSSFGLRVRRHRYFESNLWLMSVPCDHENQGRPVGVYGSHGEPNGEFMRPNGGRRGRKARDLEDARDAMGMPWASWHGCAEAIPPAFSAYIGAQLLEQMVVAA